MRADLSCLQTQTGLLCLVETGCKEVYICFLSLRYVVHPWRGVERKKRHGFIYKPLLNIQNKDGYKVCTFVLVLRPELDLIHHNADSVEGHKAASCSSVLQSTSIHYL